MNRLTEWNNDKTHGQLIKGDGITKLCRYEDSNIKPENLPKVEHYATTLREAIEAYGDDNISYYNDTPTNAVGYVCKNPDIAVFKYRFVPYWITR